MVHPRNRVGGGAGMFYLHCNTVRIIKSGTPVRFRYFPIYGEILG